MKDLESIKKEIKRHISLSDILLSRSLITGAIEEEQFSCPFHGTDNKKSSRFYKSTDSSYCWVCKEKLDLFSWVGKEEGLSFQAVLRVLISRYRIDISKLPDAFEAPKSKTYKTEVSKSSNNKLFVEKIAQAIKALKDEIDFEKYSKMVLAYMILRNATPEEKFDRASGALKNYILKTIEEV